MVGMCCNRHPLRVSRARRAVLVEANAHPLSNDPLPTAARLYRFDFGAKLRALQVSGDCVGTPVRVMCGPISGVGHPKLCSRLGAQGSDPPSSGVDDRRGGSYRHWAGLSARPNLGRARIALDLVWGLGSARGLTSGVRPDSG